MAIPVVPPERFAILRTAILSLLYLLVLSFWVGTVTRQQKFLKEEGETPLIPTEMFVT